jgi:carbonic anhydrase
MDARINASAAYGISLGDAHIIRNAGGSAVEGLRSLVISQQLLGTREILIFKHTGCGMLTFDNPAATGIVRTNLGEEAAAELAYSHFRGDFLPFSKLEEAVSDDVEFLRQSKLIPDDVVISGWVRELETGKVHRIV